MELHGGSPFSADVKYHLVQFFFSKSAVLHKGILKAYPWRRGKLGIRDLFYGLMEAHRAFYFAINDYA